MLTAVRLPIPRRRTDIAARYPNLLRAMCGVAILCRTEAEGALESLIVHGYDGGAEAVNHYGGAVKVVEYAWKFRAHYRQQYATEHQLSLVRHALTSFAHLLPRAATSTTTRALAAAIRLHYDAENQHTACVLNTLACLPNLTVSLAA